MSISEIIGFPGYYITEDAIVTNKRGKELKGWIWHHQNSYRRRVTLYNQDHIKKTVSVSRLVAIHFVDNPDNKPEVNHKNTDTLDDYYTNLEWVTRLENMLHASNNKLFRSNLSVEITHSISGLKLTFTSIAECRRYLKINRSCRIHQAIKEPNRTVKGFYINTITTIKL